MADCTCALSSADIFDYWAGDLSAQDQERIEDHVFACSSCAAALAEGEALAGGIRALVRSGTFHALVSETVLNRLARDGTRVRTFTLNPGDIVPCAVWEDDELLVTRLRGDFSDIEAVTVTFTLASGEELSRSDAVPVQPGQRELIDAISAEWVRRLPATTLRLRVTASRHGQDQMLGEYTLTHAGPMAHER